MKKSIAKGFTLVELVVVSTMMVIMMGAILRFIKPINNFYRSTFATADANDVGNAVMDYFESEMRYTTNVLLLEDYEGVPIVRDGYVYSQYDASVPANCVKLSDVQFTDCIIVDNVHVRGSQVAGYDASKSQSRRKGAQGAIVKVPITTLPLAGTNTIGGTLDFSKTRIAMTEEIYSDFKAEFDIGLSDNYSNNSKCLRIGTDLYRPEYENGSYIFEKLCYNQVRDMELVNINQIGGSKMTFQSYDENSVRTIDTGATPVTTNYYYDLIKRDTVPAVSTGYYNDAQRDYFTTTTDNSGNKYTYLFYTKTIVSSSTSGKVTISLYNPKNNSTTSRQWNVNTHLSESQINSWKSSLPTTYDDDTYRYTFSRIENASTGTDINEYVTNELITQDTVFRAVYDPQPLPTKFCQVDFVDRIDYNNGGVYDETSEIRDYWTSVDVYLPDESLGYTAIISPFYEPVGTREKIFDHWMVGGGSSCGSLGWTLKEDFFTYPANASYVVDGAHHHFVVYAVYADRPSVSVDFTDLDGNVISHNDAYVGFDNMGMFTPPDESSIGTIPDDQTLLGWFVDGDTTKAQYNSGDEVTGDVTYKPVLIDALSAAGIYRTKVIFHTEKKIERTQIYRQDSNDIWFNDTTTYDDTKYSWVTSFPKTTDYELYVYYKDDISSGKLNLSMSSGDWSFKIENTYVDVVSVLKGHGQVDLYLRNGFMSTSMPADWNPEVTVSESSTAGADQAIVILNGGSAAPNFTVTYYYNTYNSASENYVSGDVALIDFNKYSNVDYVTINAKNGEWGSTVNLSGDYTDLLHADWGWSDRGIKLYPSDVSSGLKLRVTNTSVTTSS